MNYFKPLLKNAPLDVILNIALHFRLSIFTVAQFTDSEPQAIYEEFMYALNKGQLKNSIVTDLTIKNLFINEKEKSKSIIEAYKYMVELSKLEGEERQAKYNELFELENEFTNLISQNKIEYTMDEYILASKFRVKYGISGENISKRMKLGRSVLVQNEARYPEEYGELKEQLKNLNEFYTLLFKSKQGVQKK